MKLGDKIPQTKQCVFGIPRGLHVTSLKLKSFKLMIYIKQFYHYIIFTEKLLWLGNWCSGFITPTYLSTNFFHKNIIKHKIKILQTSIINIAMQETKSSIPGWYNAFTGSWHQNMLKCVSCKFIICKVYCIP
jgi:hypothetical protein